MRIKLVLASTITLGILSSFVFFVFLLAAYWAHWVNFPVLIGLTILINFVLWLLSPTITDWVQNLCYAIIEVPFSQFENEHPEAANFITSTCQKYRIKTPRIRIISDANPTAFCYGSYANNARLVVSQGIFQYLNNDEQIAVIAHELGHIVHQDFILMTLATTLLQILYETYDYLLRRRRGRSGKNDPTPLIGLIAYILYFVGSYLLLYLSRTREAYADHFSAEETQNPDALSMALVRIAYGIATQRQSDNTQKLLAATRHMGISDYKSSHALGAAYRLVAGLKEHEHSKNLTRVFLFDLFNPWALISELNSTHPLTGKRIMAMSKYSLETGKSSMFDFNQILADGRALDQNKLYENFYNGVVIYFLPFLAIIPGLWIAMHSPYQPSNYATGLFFVGLAMLVQGAYMFTKKTAAPEKTTVLELMQDPYANPIQGRFVEVEGNVIGKGNAGSFFGADLMMQDQSECLIYLNYEALMPVIGNLLFGFGTAKTIIGQSARAIGWFRRSAYQFINLDSIEVNGKTYQSYARFKAIGWGICLLAIAGVLLMLK